MKHANIPTKIQQQTFMSNCVARQCLSTGEFGAWITSTGCGNVLVVYDHNAMLTKRIKKKKSILQ